MSTKKRGTRLAYHATANTVLAAQAAAASIPAGWVQVNNMVSVDVVPNAPDTFDDSDLEDTQAEPVTFLKPGMVNFTKKKNGTQTQTLPALAAAQTKYAWAVIYIDGSVEYIGSGALICTSAGAADSGGFNEKSTESYRIVSDTVI